MPGRTVPLSLSVGSDAHEGAPFGQVKIYLLIFFAVAVLFYIFLAVICGPTFKECK